MLYDYMYLIPKEEYRSLQTTSSDHAKLVDSIAGDVNGGQVNHIEIGEGGRVTIKPTDITPRRNDNFQEQKCPEKVTLPFLNRHIKLPKN